MWKKGKATEYIGFPFCPFPFFPSYTVIYYHFVHCRKWPDRCLFP